ncbi:hypothetical protein K501DRAFT_332274 [Backusella circina FSU 941]|nr:hypothetical protein K501DRAFT_332274 [Backusella circina FSU 941]
MLVATAAAEDKYPKAVNIIRPSQQNHQQHSDWLYQPYSSSFDSSCTFSTASTISNTAQPMIHHVPNEVYADPGLSFFCQKGPYINPPSLLFEKNSGTKPLVLNRTDLKKSSPPTAQGDQEQQDSILSPPLTPPPFFGLNKSFKPGLSSILTLNNNQQQLRNQLDEARMSRKIEDMEIENKSLLTLNQNLEFVVKQQSTTIHDLRKKLEEIERPLSPGLDTSFSKKGIMSITDVSESPDVIGSEEDVGEDAAFERIRHMLLNLIQQAQSAVSHKVKVSSRVISRRGSTSTADEQTKITAVKNNKARLSIVPNRRDSIHSNSNKPFSSYSPPASSISSATAPKRSLQRSLSISSSPAILSSSDNEIRPSPTSSIRSMRTSKYNKTPSTKTWKN